MLDSHSKSTLSAEENFISSELLALSGPQSSPSTHFWTAFRHAAQSASLSACQSSTLGIRPCSYSELANAMTSSTALSMRKTVFSAGHIISVNKMMTPTKAPMFSSF